jgi:hypothetical protein
MTYPTEIRLPFAEGTYRFWLPMPQVNEIEGKHGSICALEFNLRAGIGLDPKGNAIFVGSGVTDSSAIRDVIRCALIGGGQAVVDDQTIEVGPQRARELIETYVFPARPIGEAAALAWRILAAAVYGNELASPAAESPEPADG